VGATRRALVVRLLALAALAVSGALLGNHFWPNPLLCGFESDCEEVLTSRFSSIVGVPLPLLGVVAFGTLFGASLFPSRHLLRPLALAGGAAGLVLLLIQVVILGRLCRLCLIVDVSAVTIGVVELLGGRGVPPSADVRFRPLWLTAAVLVLGLGAAVGASGGSGQGSAVPPQVSALWVQGRVNVVEVADFECPHCRRMHAVVQEFLAEEGDRVHFVRLTVPMPAHAQARPASRAFLCAAEQGKGDEMAEALFRAGSPTPAECERTAATLGLSLPAFRACVLSPAIDERLDADLEWLKAASPHGLPVVWVQERMFFGIHPVESLRRAARAAEGQERSRQR
jgi:uncharacterized membrane protein